MTRYFAQAAASLLLAPAVMVAGCSETSPKSDPETRPTASVPDPGVAKAPDGPGQKAVDAAPVAKGEASPVAAGSSAGPRSVYTSLAATHCWGPENTPEDASSVHRCGGYGGVLLIVKDGDLRTDIDAGVETDFASRSEFNRPGDTIEWRIGPDDKPFAIIYRLIFDKMGDIPAKSWLVVETVGTAGKPGCRLAEIPGSTPNVNALARAKADAAADGVARCI